MAVLYPVFALALLTFIVYPLVLAARVAAVRSRQVPLNYFRVFSGEAPPDTIARTSRNLANLFEAPVLFYVASVIALIIQYESNAFIGLAWAYVLTRIAHSAIHLTYNKVTHRLTLFLLSQLVLLTMWILLFVYVINHG